MKSFREIIKEREINESPVGQVGRTKDSEALQHIENSDLAKEFRKIVKKLGGKNVARQLLSGMNNTGKKVVTETLKFKGTYVKNTDSRKVVTITDFGQGMVTFQDGSKEKTLKVPVFKSQYQLVEKEQSIEEYIRSMGFKIKEEKAGIRKKEIIFFKLDDVIEAYEDLIEAGFEDKYNFDIDEKKKSISYTV